MLEKRRSRRKGAVRAGDRTSVESSEPEPAGVAETAEAATLRLARASTILRVDQRVSLITLGVADVGRARAFYGQLGWAGQEVEETVFFPAGGVVLVLWGRDELARDAGVADAGDDGFGGIALAHNVRSDEEVRDVVAAAEAAGATVTRPCGPTFYGGYAGCFTDPDGHVWEIAHNPGFGFADDGSIVLPDFEGG